MTVELRGGDGEIAERRSRLRVLAVVVVERGLQHECLESAAEGVCRERRGGLRNVEMPDGERGYNRNGA